MTHPLKTTRKALSFDAVTATVHVPVQTLADTLAKHFSGTLQPCRPLRGMGYSHAAEIVHPDTMGRRCVVQHGEAHTHPNCVAEGTHEYDAPGLYDALQQHFADVWYPTRLDPALDFYDAPDAFDILSQQLLAFCARKNLKPDYRGDWLNGHGRTLYVYSRESRFYVRLYQYKQYHGHGPDCRLELEVKLKGRELRHRLTKLGPVDILSMCPATFEIVQALDLRDERIPVTPGPRPPNSLERDKAFLSSTAYPALARLIAHHAGAIEAAILDVLAYREETERTKRLLSELPSVTIHEDRNTP